MNLVADKILKLLRENIGDARHIEKFYFGNPGELASADLPAVFIQPLSKNIEQLDNVWDSVTGEFMIGVCVDEAEYKGEKSDEGTATRFLMEVEGGRNSDGTPIENSVMYVMRNNFTLEGVSVHQEYRTVWGERKITGGVAKEIHMYFTIRYKIKNTS